MELSIDIPSAGVNLPCDLTVPQRACGIVVFAHGSGSSRHSPRNRAIAAALNEHRFSTLLMDLLVADDPDEARFDVPLMSRRLIGTLAWTLRNPRAATLPVGLFGASTGAAAALVAASQVREVRAVVSRGGRPDLAGDAIDRVACPTLLVVGGADHPVLELNRAALARMPADAELHVVDGATHLFEESGALDEVSRVAVTWFAHHLCARHLRTMSPG
jgi:dienelactone hydrolase